ncbi:MAG: cysteine desulfurase NifS [Lachnospiraceae bacterium]|nr:cysteine desulfurase NifS [Lachnospiraceae bacterium]
MDSLIYLDNAATAKMSREVFEAMQPYFCEEYWNPSSAYSVSGALAQKVQRSREVFSGLLGCDSKEIYFTGGGSESDNWAIKGVADALIGCGKHVITSAIEHHAVLHTCKFLEDHGFEVTYLPVDENGLVDTAQLEAAIRPDTVLISIMTANNEIGTIEPVKEIGQIAKKHNVYFHTDAVQAFGHIPIDVNDMNIDLLSASAHKIGGPKGVGLMYIRKGTKISNLIHGGAQERGMRAGTVNAAGIIGFAQAAKIASEKMKENADHERALRDRLIERVLEEIPYSRLNGDRKMRLPNNANFCFRYVEGESLLIMLDKNGICASSGSACTSGSLDPSHVLLAIGLPHEIAHGSLRLTLSPETTARDIDRTVDTLKTVVQRLREMSPLYEDMKGETK